MSLFLVRHPQVDAPPGWCYGRSDLPLAADIAACAASLRVLLPEPCAVVSSPLQRCRRLAEAITPAACIDPDWQELDFGAWENRAFDALPRAGIDAWARAPWAFRMPQGESGNELLARVRRALERLRDDAWNGAVAVITHAGPIRAAVGLLSGEAQVHWLALPVPVGSVRHLQWTPQGGVRLGPPHIYAPEEA